MFTPPQAFSELQLQNAELRRRLEESEDADLCKNNCNTSDRLATQAMQNCSRLEKKPEINMSLPSSYAGDPLKLELEEVKLERLDGNVKMIPEVKDNLWKIVSYQVNNLVHFILNHPHCYLARLTVRHRMVRSGTLCHLVNLTMLGKEGSRWRDCRRGFP